MASLLGVASACYALLLLVLLSPSCSADGSQFGLDIHHRFSDPVKGILGGKGLPVKGSLEYYVAMTQRDNILRSRHLAVSNDQSPSLTFAGGNDTYLYSIFGFLHYANVSVGTPSLSFLVALDTGSDLFWLPCDCKRRGCVRGIRSNGQPTLVFSIYSPSNSSTSEILSCNSSLCPKKHCTSASSNCSYEVVYLSNNTSSTGILVEDVLHLVTDDDLVKAVDTRITFGCGQQQLGTFLEGGAPNGLFGLGMKNISVPSTLARNGIASNSFSMCFGHDGSGRITFGDSGSSDQKETPFNVREPHPTYNVSITKITVGKNSSEIGFSAIFDSGTSFSFLSDPAYTTISQSFDSQVQEHRYLSHSELPFEYCYKLSANVTNITIPDVNLTMQGGGLYFLNDPIILLPLEKGYGYCLGLHRSENINIIGQNFMTGYRIIFDRKRMVLGWKQANCYDNEYSNSLPPSPAPSPAVLPPPSINPDAASRTGSNSSIPIPASSTHSQKLKPFTRSLILLLSWIVAVL